MTKFRFLNPANQGTHDLDPKPFVAGTAVWLVDRKMPSADVTWKPNIR